MSKRSKTGKKKNSGCGCLLLLLLLIVFGVYAAGQSEQEPARALPTAARIDAAAPRPTRTARPPTTVPTGTTAAEVVSVAQVEPVRDQIAALATAYPEEALKAVLGAVDGVEEVTTAVVTLGPSVYSELAVETGAVTVQTADRLRLALVLEETIEEYVFILDDGRLTSDFTYRDGQWTATVLDLSRDENAPTSTPRPAANPTRAATAAPVVNTAEVVAMPDQDFWAANGINVRECPSTSCAAIGRVNQGTQLTANGRTEGEAVNSGNRVWYRVQYGGGYGFVYSGVVTDRAPVLAPTAAPQVQQPAPEIPLQPPSRRPQNCTDARAMGLTAEQAAQWDHLDRDDDGVACYGD